MVLNNPKKSAFCTVFYHPKKKNYLLPISQLYGYQEIIWKELNAWGERLQILDESLESIGR